MSVLMTRDKKETVITCECGCMNAFHVKIYEEEDMDLYRFLCFIESVKKSL